MTGKAGRVAGKVALITGAAQGLGAAISHKLASEGARVLLTDINADGATAQADAINAAYGAGTALARHLDVTDPADWAAAVNCAGEHFGGLSVLVNNAGICLTGTIESCSFADWQRSFSINVDSVFHGCRAAIPLMRESQPASIVNISSIAGLIASDAMAAYNASKAAVWMLTKSVALHCAKQGWDIRCNSVHPTFIDTPILDDISTGAKIDKDVMLGKLARQIPIGRIGVPDDVANGVLFLASDESRFMTAAELKLDGGISAM